MSQNNTKQVEEWVILGVKRRDDRITTDVSRDDKLFGVSTAIFI